ncbi:hypothetical protein ACKKBG_A16910 [Auxenochlorella protothecoides x Auxenochlorella symbiontica]
MAAVLAPPPRGQPMRGSVSAYGLVDLCKRLEAPGAQPPAQGQGTPRARSSPQLGALKHSRSERAGAETVSVDFLEFTDGAFVSSASLPALPDRGGSPEAHSLGSPTLRTLLLDSYGDQGRLHRPSPFDGGVHGSRPRSASVTFVSQPDSALEAGLQLPSDGNLGDGHRTASTFDNLLESSCSHPQAALHELLGASLRCSKALAPTPSHPPRLMPALAPSAAAASGSPTRPRTPGPDFTTTLSTPCAAAPGLGPGAGPDQRRPAAPSGPAAWSARPSWERPPPASYSSRRAALADSSVTVVARMVRTSPTVPLPPPVFAWASSMVEARPTHAGGSHGGGGGGGGPPAPGAPASQGEWRAPAVWSIDPDVHDTFGGHAMGPPARLPPAVAAPRAAQHDLPHGAGPGGERPCQARSHPSLPCQAPADARRAAAPPGQDACVASPGELGGVRRASSAAVIAGSEPVQQPPRRSVDGGAARAAGSAAAAPPCSAPHRTLAARQRARRAAATSAAAAAAAAREAEGSGYIAQAKRVLSAAVRAADAAAGGAAAARLSPSPAAPSSPRAPPACDKPPASPTSPLGSQAGQSGSIAPLLAYIRGLDPADPALPAALGTLRLMVSNAPNRGVVLACGGAAPLFRLLHARGAALGVREAAVGLLWELDAPHTPLGFTMQDVLGLGRVLDDTASPQAAMQVVHLLHASFYSDQRATFSVEEVTESLGSTVGVLFNGAVILPDSAQFSLGSLLAGVFDESILPLAHLEGTLTRMLTCLPRPEVAAARKQAVLTVLSCMASSGRVMQALDSMHAAARLLHFGHATLDPRLRARALSLVKVLNHSA